MGQASGEDHHHQTQHHCQMDDFIASRVSKGMVRAHGLGEDGKASSERRQVTRQALRVGQIGQRTHLQSIGSPAMLIVQIEAPRRVQAQLVVVRETKWLVRPRWIDRDGSMGAPVIGFTAIQLSHAEDDRSMIHGLAIVQEVRVETLVLAQI